jgi:cysteine desulfurase/selenocysteine lyase
VPGLQVLGPAGTHERLGVLTFRLADVPHMLVASVLGYEWGVGVRAGCFCAHPGMLHLLEVPPDEARRISALIESGDKRSVPGAVRASLGLYNTAADVDVLVEGLQAIAAGRYARRYELDARSGDYEPSGWLPHHEAFFSATHAERRSPARRMTDS